MNGIRYVIVSDLHLAAANSVLTQLTPDKRRTLPHEPSDLLRQLVHCLQHVLAQENSDEKVTLILNGDILELALAGTNEAAMTFQGFIGLLMDQNRGGQRFNRQIYYSSGNHDHHVWNTARETQYVDKYIRQVPPGSELNGEYYVTNMFRDEKLNPVPAYLLNALFERTPGFSDLCFTLVYPNFALLNSDKTRSVIIHHGHYLESIYSLIRRLKDIFFPGRERSDKIWDLEAENGAWVDFFWSTLGRSGEVGAGVGLIYDKMQDQKQFQQLLRNLARSVAPSLPLARWPGVAGIETQILTELLECTLGKFASREVHDDSAELSADAETGLKEYLERYVMAEIKRGNAGAVPPEITFIFGHTHKPFEKSQRYAGYDSPVKLLNSGGWVVDSRTVDELHGGAILFVDDEMNTASIRMYNESDSPDGYRVKVTAAVTDRNPLFERLSALVRPEEEQWESFSEAAAQAVTDHRENLEYNIARADTESTLIT